MSKRKAVQREMTVRCGSVKWRGAAASVEEAIIAALTDLPKAPAVLLRVHDGLVYHYIEFWAAMKLAGYNRADFDPVRRRK